MDHIRAEVERVSQAGPDHVGLERSLAELRRLSTVNAHWGISSSWPVLGRFEVLAKRAMRIMLRWYINPLVEQQNAFNLAMLASLYEIEAQLHTMHSDMHQYRLDLDQDSET